jgi:hypothetical protein
VIFLWSLKNTTKSKKSSLTLEWNESVLCFLPNTEQSINAWQALPLANGYIQLVGSLPPFNPQQRRRHLGGYYTQNRHTISASPTEQTWLVWLPSVPGNHRNHRLPLSHSLLERCIQETSSFTGLPPIAEGTHTLRLLHPRHNSPASGQVPADTSQTTVYRTRLATNSSHLHVPNYQRMLPMRLQYRLHIEMHYSLKGYFQFIITNYCKF